MGVVSESRPYRLMSVTWKFLGKKKVHKHVNNNKFTKKM